MKKWLPFYRINSIVLLVVFFFTSCNEEIEDPLRRSSLVKETIYESMMEWYFWNETLPSPINLRRSGSNEELLEELKYTPLDKWSYLTTPQDFNKAFVGQNAGHGVGFTVTDDDKVFLSFVYADSPAGKDGWQRGWEIIEVNDRPLSAYRKSNGYDLQLGSNAPGVTNTFKFRLADGSLVKRTIPKADYQSNSVLYQTVFEEGGKRIGYWVYNSFKVSPQVKPAKSIEVEESMAYFQAKHINEFIIDLRYNGGGSVAVAEQILNYLVPADASEKLMYTNSFNKEKSELNEEQFFEKIGDLNLSRVVFITSRGSASSSELLINCLSPYLDLVLVGDNTYGKPVGAFPLSGYYKVLRENNVELVPITFAIANANGKASYYEGFPVDYAVSDDPSKNWGDPGEERLNAALNIIIQGGVGERGKRSYTAPTWAMIDNFKGLQQEFPVY